MSTLHKSLLGQKKAQNAPVMVSVNQLKNWSRCKRKFQLDHVRHLYWPSDQSNFQFGQEVHKLLDYQSRNLNLDVILNAATSEVQQAWQLLNNHPITRLPILGSEWGFLVPVDLSAAGISGPPCFLTGRIDRIATDPGSETVLVIDWKTGTAVPKMPEQDWQTRVYLYALWEARQQLGLADLHIESMKFCYVEVKSEIRLIEVPYSQQQHQQTQALLESTIARMIQEEVFDLPDSCPDKYCPYLNVCGILEQQ